MIKNLNLILERRITGIFQNHIEKTVMLSLDNQTTITFLGCVLVIDSGIIGHDLTYLAETSTLGITLEFKRMKLDADDFKHLLISRDIKDYKNKNEFLVSYKEVRMGSISPSV